MIRRWAFLALLLLLALPVFGGDPMIDCWNRGDCKWSAGEDLLPSEATREAITTWNLGHFSEKPMMTMEPSGPVLVMVDLTAVAGRTNILDLSGTGSMVNDPKTCVVVKTEAGEVTVNLDGSVTIKPLEKP